MLFNLFANGDENTFKNFTSQQREIMQSAFDKKDLVESRYYNPNSPLSEAQKYSDTLMMMEKRVPMVIEYYKRKPEGPEDDYIESVDMYINPQRLSISTQKVKGKAYTRGGIFYHHWGDDHLTMQLSGTVGLSGMKGIEQLEQIYYHSGALLRYQNLGPDKIGQYEGAYKDVDFNDPSGVLDYLISNDLASGNQKSLLKKMNDAKNSQTLTSQRKMFDIISYIADGYLNTLDVQNKSTAYENLQVQVNKYYNKYLKDNNQQAPSFENLYQYTQSLVNNDKNYATLSDNIKISIAFEIVKNYYSDKFSTDTSKLLSSIGLQLDSDTVYSKMRDITSAQADEIANYIQAINNINENARLSRETSFEGWKDIADELMDEWRPRQVFIYFEDRVYIGHFDLFSYQRVAEHPLIQYEMRLTIFRQIITTSNNSDKKPDVANTYSGYFQNIASETTTPTNDDNVVVDGVEEEIVDLTNNDFKAKFDIYRLRILYSQKLQAARHFADKQIPSNETELYIDSIHDLRNIAGIIVSKMDKSFPDYALYNCDDKALTTELSWDLRLKFYGMAKSNAIMPSEGMTKEETALLNYKGEEALNAAKDQITLFQSIMDKEIKNGDINKPGRREEIQKYIDQTKNAAGIS